jgi:hypothetical protein
MSVVLFVSLDPCVHSSVAAYGAGEDPASRASNCNNNQLVLLRRSVEQDQGAWVIDYQLRCANHTGIIVAAADVKASVKGWVSNSRVASHAIPHLAQVTVKGALEGSSTGDVITSNDESQQCRERVVITVWGDDNSQPGSLGAPLVSLAPHAKVHVRLRLEHQHVLYGEYDPLLGVRSVELTIGDKTLQDKVILDHEQYVAQPKCIWPEPPLERRDTRHFISPPDSLHLEAHVPGHQYYRFPDRPVRYGTRFRLRFWYLIAAGTEGECRVRIDEYKDTPTSWRPLSNSGLEQTLETIGRWTKVEKIIRVADEATTVALGFRIMSETNVGEMWVDEVSLEPVANSAERGMP